MSGDVSGYMIVTGELTGILLLALVGGRDRALGGKQL